MIFPADRLTSINKTQHKYNQNQHDKPQQR